MQLTAKFKVATPANWKVGDEVIIAGSVTDEAAKSIYPDGWPETVPPLHPAARKGRAVRNSVAGSPSSWPSPCGSRKGRRFTRRTSPAPVAVGRFRARSGAAAHSPPPERARGTATSAKVLRRQHEVFRMRSIP